MKMNYALYKNIPCKIVECADPTILMKAMKNETELKNIREAHIKDGSSHYQIHVLGEDPL